MKYDDSIYAVLKDNVHTVSKDNIYTVSKDNVFTVSKDNVYTVWFLGCGVVYLPMLVVSLPSLQVPAPPSP